MNGIVSGLLSLQDKQIRENTALDALIRERKRTETALNNIISAIERGITSNTTNKRLHELEEQQDKLDRQIIIEKSKVAVKVTEKEIREFYVQALKCEPQMLINTLVKEIVLYDDKIEIYFNSPLKVSPDNSQGFSFVYKTVKISYRTS